MANKETSRFEGDVYFATSLEPAVYGNGSVTFEGDLIVNGSATITGGVDAFHSSLTGLLSDDHTQYALLAGRSGGQIFTSGTTASSNLILRSTTNATKGSVVLDETTSTTSNSTGSLKLSGGIGISNTTDSTSSTNGGTITTAGGIAIAKKAYIGTDLSIGGNITSGTWNGSTVLVQYGGTGQATFNTNSVLLGNGISGIQSPTTITYSSNTLTVPKIISGDVTASSSPHIGAVLLSGGLSISNTTDASSSTNGGTFTTEGGLAVAKRVYVGTDLNVGGNLSVTGTAALPHANFTGLENDDHTQYARLGGRAVGQIFTSGTTASANLTLRSTSNVTKGSIVLDETTSSTSSTSGALKISGGIGISNTTDATSSTNGGTFTTAGGLSVAKKVYIGTDLSVGGDLTVSGIAALPHENFTGLLNDDHTQYALLSGRNSGQIFTSGTIANATLTLRSTSNATKGSVIFDETTTSISSTSGALKISGGIGISNTTDATSSTNGGTFTTAGGIAVAKKAYIGGNLIVSGTISGTWAGDIINIALGGTGQSSLNSDSILLGNGTGGIQSPVNLTFTSNTLTTPKIISNDTTATTSSVTGAVLLSGGLSISNSTEATSSTNGGTITTAGGLAVSKKAYIGGNISIGGDLIVSGTAALPHSNFTGLSNDDHTQYALLAGRNSGQIFTSGTSASANLTLRSTSNVTKGSVVLDETTTSISSTSGALKISGGIGISNTTDATSSINGGTFTTAGGLSVAKKVFIGTDLSVGSIITSGIWNGDIINVTYGGTGASTLTSNSVLLGNGTGSIQSPSTITYTSSTLTLPKIISNDTTATTSNSTGSVIISGGISISNTTDSISSTNGGTFTTAGGVAIAKKLFVGSNSSFSNTLDMNNNKILNVATPTNPNDAANKNYVDSVVQGLDVKAAAHVATTGPLTLATDFENGDTIDGHVISTGERVLIKNQTNGVENGIYTVNSTGAPSRTSDFNTGLDVGTSFIFVETGTVNSDSGWVCTNNTGSDIVGTDSLVFARFSGAGSIIAGTGLTKTGDTLSVNASQTQVTALGTITSGTWNASILSPVYGGTGASTLISNSVLLGNGTGVVQSPATITYSSSTLTLPKIVSNDNTASTSSSTGSVLVSGGIAISNTTDATSSTDGGTITTAGGLSVAKKVFVGMDLNIGGNLIVTGTAALPHANLTGLLNDDHTQYAILSGRAVGQIFTSGTTASANLTLRSTTSATKGSIVLDETTSSTSNSTGALRLSGGIGISNTTDATSSTNGGTFTTAGGLSVAKKVYIGTNLNVGGDLIVTGTAALPHANLTGLLNDDHTQYANLSGRAVGQIFTSGTTASANLTLRSTTSATKGSIVLDETTSSTSNSTGSLLISGGIGVLNTTDATSSTSGGTFTSAGGLAVAKKAYIGTDLSVGGNIINGTWNATTISPVYGGTGTTSFLVNSLLIGNGTSAVQTSSNLTFTANTLSIPKLTSTDTTASTSSITGSVLHSGGFGLSNTTDAVSSTNGGTFTTAGGLAVAKKVFIGTDLSVGGNTSILGNLTLTGTLNLPHSSLLNLLNDDHTQYALLAGRNGGQILTSGTGAGNSLILRSTTNATKGSILIDETTNSTSSLTGALRVSGGIGISNATDADSVLNGGSFTTAGGLSIGKKLFVGTGIESGIITITNSTQNILNINCQGSVVNPGKILFTNTAGTGDFIISGDGGDVQWQGGGGRALQMGAYHEIRLLGGRVSTADISFVSGSSGTFNTIVQNTSNSIALRIQSNVTQTQNLTQWTTSGGTVLSSIDSLGNFSGPIVNLSNYLQMTSITSPTNPGGSQFKYYTDSSDSLLKSKNSTGTITVYQPTNTKGDIVVHNGTVAVRLPVGIDNSLLVADSTDSNGVIWNSRAYARIRDEKIIGTSGGGLSSGSWVTRTLNTSTSFPSGQNEITLAGNIISLDPGTYKIICNVPGHRVGIHTSRIMDNVLNTVLLVGTSSNCTAGQDVTTYSNIYGILTVPPTTTLDIRIEQRCTSTRLVTGQGIASGLQTEVYTQIIIEKF